MHALSINLSQIRKQSLRQLFLRHFETEDGDRLLPLEGSMKADIQDQRCVVNQNVLGNEVARFGHGQVIDLVLSTWSYGDDLVPIDLVTRELRKPAIAKHVGVIRQPSSRSAAHSLGVGASVAGP